MIARCITGVFSYGCLAASVMLLPLSIATIIQNTNTFWTAILGFRMVGDRIKAFELMCMIGCFAGILILTQTKTESDEDNNLTKGSYYTYLGGIGIGIFNCWCYSFIIVATRKMQDIAHFTTVYLYSIACVLGFLIMIII